MIGPAEIIVILIPLVLIISAIVWSRRKSKNSSFNIPMTWYYFYTYIRLPLGILLGLATAFQTKIIENVLLTVVLVIFQIIVIIGLSNFKIWGWNINLFLLIAECFIYSINRTQGELYRGIVLFVLMALLWFLPNFIYFKKRIQLFS